VLLRSLKSAVLPRSLSQALGLTTVRAMQVQVVPDRASSLLPADSTGCPFIMQAWVRQLSLRGGARLTTRLAALWPASWRVSAATPRLHEVQELAMPVLPTIRTCLPRQWPFLVQILS
jgi:hypothetical protein